MRAGDQHRRPPTRRALLRAGAGQPADGRRRPGPRGVHRGAATRCARRPAPPVRLPGGRRRPRHQGRHAARPWPRCGCRGHGAARGQSPPRRSCALRPGRRVLLQRARRPGRARLRGRRRCAACSPPGSRCSASAWAARSSAGPSAWAPTSCASGTAASTSRSRTCAPAGCRSPATTTASRSPCPGRRSRHRSRRGPRRSHPYSRTDFGRAADHPRQPQRRRGRGACAARRARLRVQYHPEAAPGPHDAAGLFGEFCALMAARPGGA